MINAFSIRGMDFSMDEKGRGNGSKSVMGRVDISLAVKHMLTFLVFFKCGQQTVASISLFWLI